MGQAMPSVGVTWPQTIPLPAHLWEPNMQAQKPAAIHTSSINAESSSGSLCRVHKGSRSIEAELLRDCCLWSSRPVEQAWSPPPTKLAPGVLPSFLEVPSEVAGEEVLVQIKVTQIAPAAQNVVGDLQEAGRGPLPGAINLPWPGAGEEKARPTLNQFHWRAAGFLHLEAGPVRERK